MHSGWGVVPLLPKVIVQWGISELARLTGGAPGIEIQILSLRGSVVRLFQERLLDLASVRTRSVRAALDQPAALMVVGFKRLFDSRVSAFVVRKPVSCKFALRVEFDVDLMQFGFAFGDNANV